jgi:hypothetical protein
MIRTLFTIAIAAISCQTMFAAETNEVVYESFVVNPHDQKTLSFRFSSAPATSKSPIIITAVGRELTEKDRGKYRVDLQKVWLQHNVPKTYEFVARFLVECEFKRKGEFNACDRYTLEDPKTKRCFDYYIYVGNWP